MNEKKIDRETRYKSRVLVEIRKYRFWPFQTESALILDMSIKGLKMALVGEMIPVKDKTYWLTIPFAPFGFASQESLSCLISCVWWNSESKTMGGIFMDLGQSERETLDQMIMILEEQLH